MVDVESGGFWTALHLGFLITRMTKIMGNNIKWRYQVVLSLMGGERESPLVDLSWIAVQNTFGHGWDRARHHLTPRRSALKCFSFFLSFFLPRGRTTFGARNVWKIQFDAVVESNVENCLVIGTWFENKEVLDIDCYSFWTRLFCRLNKTQNSDLVLRSLR